MFISDASPDSTSEYIESGEMNQDAVKGLFTVLNYLIKSNISGEKELTDIDVEHLFRTNGIIEKIITKYPNEAKETGYNVINDNGDIVDESDELLLEAFKEASIYARLYRISYLKLVFENDLNEAVPIRRGSKLSDFSIHFDLSREGDFYEIENERIHYERVLIFYGKRTYSKYARPIDPHYADSIILSIKKAFDDYIENSEASKYILRNLSYLGIGMNNLANTVQKEVGQNRVYERLTALNQSRSIYKTIAYDKEKEEMNFVSQTLTGVIEVIRESKELLMSSTGYPYEQIFENPPNFKIGSSGVQNQLIVRYLWAKRIKTWSTNEWKPNLTTYYSRTSDMTGRKIDIPLLLELTLEEQAIVEEKAAKRIKDLRDSGVISVYEGRTGYEGDKFTMNIKLDDAVFEREKASAENLQEQVNQPQNGRTNRTTGQQDDLSKDSLLPDDDYWDELARVTTNDLDNIGRDVLS